MSWISSAWTFYLTHEKDLTPLLVPLGTILVGLGTVTVGIGTIWVSRQQARTAVQQAETAAKQAQLAERGAVTTAFHSAVNRLASDKIKERLGDIYILEQIASDKIKERLGDIYILEQIARDSLDDHWPVMETLTAFVRERAKWEATATASQPAPALSEIWQSGPATASAWVATSTDIAAALTVIGRRPEVARHLENQKH